jgi:hypothetical protein
MKVKLTRIEVRLESLPDLSNSLFEIVLVLYHHFIQIFGGQQIRVESVLSLHSHQMFRHIGSEHLSEVRIVKIPFALLIYQFSHGCYFLLRSLDSQVL